MHEERAEVIIKTYALLKNFYTRMADYVKFFEPAGGTSREERCKEARDAHNEFKNYYDAKLILLPKATTNEIEKINNELVKVFHEFVGYVDKSQETDENRVEKWDEIYDRVTGEIKATLDELEGEFRKLFGDEG